MIFVTVAHSFDYVFLLSIFIYNIFLGKAKKFRKNVPMFRMRLKISFKLLVCYHVMHVTTVIGNILNIVEYIYKTLMLYSCVYSSRF